MLILDNYSSHISAAKIETFTNVMIRFFQPNLTSVIQPCDAGIIFSFKSHYRRFFLIKMEEKSLELLNQKHH